MSKHLDNFEIDDKVREEVESRTFIVNGKSLNFRNLCIAVFSKDYDKFPEEQAEARKIYNALAEELGQPKLGEKAPEKETNASGYADYIRLLKANHEKTAQTKVKLDEELEKAKSDYEEQIYLYGNDKYMRNSAEIELRKAENKHHDEMEKLINQSQLEIARLRTGFQEKLVEFYTPDGKAIDNDTVALLQSGIKLTETEINNLVNKHSSNPTMIRLISGYCEDKGLKYGGVLSANKLVMGNGKSELEIFDTVSGLTNLMFTSDGAYWSKPERYGQIMENKIQEICKNPLHPEEYTAPTIKEPEGADKGNEGGNNPTPSFTSVFN